MSNLAELLSQRSVIVCMGPGGVGKTTTAAALAIAGAEQGLRVVVLTVDPARRLAQAMGVGVGVGTQQQSRPGDNAGLGNEPTQILGPWPGELWGAMLDPKATFDGLIDRYAESDRQRDVVLRNRIYQNLTSSLGGTNEYMAVERLLALHLDERFDLVVLDTPPAQHAIDLLDSPGRLSRFVDHKLYRTILAPRPGVLRAVTSAANVVVRAIGQVVGSTLLADAIEFFNNFAGMDRGFRDRAVQIDRVLAAPETAYVLVCSARSEPLDAARWIATQLGERDRSIEALVINRLTPNFWPLSNAEKHSPEQDVWRRSELRLERNLADLMTLRDREVELVQSARPDLGNPVVTLVDERAEPVVDIDGLRAIGESLVGKTTRSR